MAKTPQNNKHPKLHAVKETHRKLMPDGTTKEFQVTKYMKAPAPKLPTQPQPPAKPS